MRVVFGKNFHLAPCVRIVGFHLVCSQTLLLVRANEILHLARRILFIVHVHRLHQPLDRGKLVAAVENLKGLRQIRLAVMRAQHAVAQPVKRAYPQAARVDRQHRGQAREHFLGRFVGESHRQNAMRADRAGADQISDARSQHARLAAARPRKDQSGLVRQSDSLALFGIEAGKQGGIHGRIIPQDGDSTLRRISRFNAAPHRNDAMRPSIALQTHREAIREIALRHRVRNVRVFGSVLHGKDTEDSDLDLLVEPTSETTLMDIARIQVEVAKLLNVSVDVLTPNALPDKFRAQVMTEAVTV